MTDEEFNKRWVEITNRKRNKKNKSTQKTNHSWLECKDNSNNKNQEKCK